MLVDRDPAPNGNLRLERKPGDIPRAVAVPAAYRVAGELLFSRHDSTCPYAERPR
jgi:hypothetical protein